MSEYWEFHATDSGRTGSIQTWTVPSSGLFYIEACGAQGGTGSRDGIGGKGAKVSGEFYLEGDQVIEILVGQQGSYDGNPEGPSGGGGTFVCKQGAEDEDDILLIAGGGGGYGVGTSTDYQEVAHAHTETWGKDGDGTSLVDPASEGGENGEGGEGVGNRAAGGGGFYSDGGDGSYSGSGGHSFLRADERGYGGDGHGEGLAGFGGGGAVDDTTGWGAASGGGGYSGGGGAYADSSDAEAAGGGGGSYNNGENQDNEDGVREGDGYCYIELLPETRTADPFESTDSLKAKYARDYRFTEQAIGEVYNFRHPRITIAHYIFRTYPFIELQAWPVKPIKIVHDTSFVEVDESKSQNWLHGWTIRDVKFQETDQPIWPWQYGPWRSVGVFGDVDTGTVFDFETTVWWDKPVPVDAVEFTRCKLQHPTLEEMNLYPASMQWRMTEIGSLRISVSLPMDEADVQALADRLDEAVLVVEKGVRYVDGSEKYSVLVKAESLRKTWTKQPRSLYVEITGFGLDEFHKPPIKVSPLKISKKERRIRNGSQELQVTMPVVLGVYPKVEMNVDEEEYTVFDVIVKWQRNNASMTVKLRG